MIKYGLIIDFYNPVMLGKTIVIRDEISDVYLIDMKNGIDIIKKDQVKIITMIEFMTVSKQEQIINKLKKKMTLDERSYFELD